MFYLLFTSEHSYYYVTLKTWKHMATIPSEKLQATLGREDDPDFPS